MKNQLYISNYDKIIKCSIKHNKLLSNSRRDIIVLNSYVINLMFCL